MVPSAHVLSESWQHQLQAVLLSHKAASLGQKMQACILVQARQQGGLQQKYCSCSAGWPAELTWWR